MQRGALQFLCLAVVFCSLGLTSLGQDIPKPEPPKKDSESAKTTVNEAAPVEGAAAPVDPKSYKIGPEDVVDIRVWRDEALSGRFIVRPDGYITLPVVGELKIEGLTPEQVKVKSIELYSKIVNRPEVTVSLSAVRSKKYYLVGQVLKTGMFPLIIPTTVLEAINSAGGFREFANTKKIYILRSGKRIRFNYDEVIKGKNMDQNILLENGDHIIVQ